ncbi:MAG: hypothetical protein ACO35C_04955 [Pontimonas sp.]
MPLHGRAREFAARRFFDHHGLAPYIVAHNRVLPGTPYRPDFLFVDPATNVAVVVECDEDSHRRGYDRGDETHREYRIVRRLEDMGYAPVTLVRFDPSPDRTRFGARACVQLQTVTDCVLALLRNEDVSHVVARSPFTTVKSTRHITRIQIY